MKSSYDAVVVGSGPNGLAAAIALAERGRSVLVLEGAETIGGGARSAELTLPGFVHDVCSTAHPMGAASPFFRTLPLQEHGLSWVHPQAPLAHPLDDGTAVVLERSVQRTAANLGVDATSYSQLMGSTVRNWRKIEPLLFGPVHFPRHPLAAARFGIEAIRSARGLAASRFRGERARALFAGVAAHSFLPLERMPSAAFGLVLGAAGHVAGWPFARGGSQNISNALASYLRSLGGEISTGRTVESLEDLPRSDTILCDVTPRQLVRMAGARLNAGTAHSLERYRYGPGVCKVDWALDGPIPWTAASCAQAGTIHIGGTLEEICASERAVWHGEHIDRPFVLLTQPTLFDASRAPAGKHIAWGYCHVPNGSNVDMSGRIEAQVERFAPGFRNRILARNVMAATAFERYNPNLAGGDIAAGVTDLRQLFIRPTRRLYRTGTKGLYICSASTPPGAGVHGMCGYHAARAVLSDFR